LYSPAVLLWVVTATRTCTTIFCGNCQYTHTGVGEHVSLCSSMLVAVWGATSMLVAVWGATKTLHAKTLDAGF